MSEKDKKEEGGGLDFVVEPLSEQELEDVSGGTEAGPACTNGGGCDSGGGCKDGGIGEAEAAV